MNELPSSPQPAAVPEAVAARSVPGTAGWLDSPWLLAGLLALAAVFQLLTIRSGHNWGDDFALYILHARALLEGRPYVDTGFIYSSAFPQYSPAAYPPGFPLLLLPVYAFSGLNFVAMKVLVTLFLAGALVLFALLLRPLLPRPYLLVTVALLGFMPHWTVFKNEVVPEFPFVFFVMLSLLLLRRIDEARPTGWRALEWGLLVGAAIYAATSLRTIGVALYGALALTALLRRRFPPRALLACFAIGLALWLWQRSIMPASSGYMAQVTDVTTVTQRAPFDLTTHFRHTWRLVGQTRILWAGLPWALTWIIRWIVLALGLAGFLSRLRRFGYIETFTLSYCAILFAYPIVLNLRYLIPVTPFLLYYACTALLLLVRRFGRPAVAGATALLLVVVASYAGQFATADYGRITTGALGANAADLYAAVRRCTGPDDRIGFYKARAMVLFTGRPSLFWPAEESNVNLVSYMRAAEIRYVAVRRNVVLDSVAWNPANRLRLIFSNRTFNLYHNEALPDALDAPPDCTASDSVATAVAATGEGG